MRARSHAELDSIRKSVDRARKLSDRIVGLGPFSLGLDGVLAWIPGAGFLYSVGAGGFLLVQAMRAHASPGTLVKMAGLLTADSVTDVIPVPGVPSVADMLFTAHKWAADALLKDIEGTVYYPGSRREAEADPRYHEVVGRQRTGEDPRKRVVFLGGRN